MCLDNGHSAQEGAHPLDHVHLTLWPSCTGNFGEQLPLPFGVLAPTDLGIDLHGSGFRISKISLVNPALTLFTPRPVVTGTGKGQCLLFILLAGHC